jgi:hypothetical protein
VIPEPTQEQDTTVAQVEYRPIEGFPGYRVGDDGTVVSTKFGWRVMKPSKNKKGYPHVCLSNRDRQSKTLDVHRIVTMAFHGPCPDGMEVCHNDGNPDNNSAANLRWDTRKANHADKLKHGTSLRGRVLNKRPM